MTQGWQLVWGARRWRLVGDPSVEREERGRLAGNSSVERNGAGRLATRLGSENGETDDPSVEREGRGWLAGDDDIKSLPAQNIRRLPVLLSSLA